jgi:TonB family protein
MRTLIALVSVLATFPAAAADPPPALSHEEIKSTVDAHIGDIKACMRDHGAATGKLVVQFGIQPDGKVVDPKPKERSSNDALDRCIAKAFGGFTFPKPRGGVLMGVVYPFTFAPPKAPPQQGKLEQDAVVKTVKGHSDELQACYDAAKERLVGTKKSTLKGVVKVAFVISPKGSVSEAKVDNSTTNSPVLDSCVVDKLKSWTFPKPQGGEAAFLYPFSFGGEMDAAPLSSQPKQH